MDEALIRLEQNMSRKPPAKPKDKVRIAAKKPLSLRYAEIVRLRRAIQLALSEFKSSDVERRASK
jgi:hypothetical protein